MAAFGNEQLAAVGEAGAEAAAVGRLAGGSAGAIARQDKEAPGGEAGGRRWAAEACLSCRGSRW